MDLATQEDQILKQKDYRDARKTPYDCFLCRPHNYISCIVPGTFKEKISSL